MRTATEPAGITVTRAARSGRSWLSAHLGFAGALYSEQCDEVLRAVVAPTVQRLRKSGWVDSYFFVRYGLGGPHVRLRLRGQRGVLLNKVAPALARGARRWTNTSAAVQQLRISRMSWIAYEPESDRYGGPRGLVVAELLACASSQFVLDLLASAKEVDQERRLGAGLVAFLVLTKAFFDDTTAARAFVRRYKENYLTTVAKEEAFRGRMETAYEGAYLRQQASVDAVVSDVWRALGHGDLLGAPYDRFYGAARRAALALSRLSAHLAITVHGHRTRSYEQARAAILPSYVHMTMNRLGLTILHESYLASVIASALEGCDDA